MLRILAKHQSVNFIRFHENVVMIHSVFGSNFIWGITALWFSCNSGDQHFPNPNVRTMHKYFTTTGRIYHKPYIVLIDDDCDDLQMLSTGLEQKGIRVKCFGSTTKALFYLISMAENGELPLLIIMDYNMPQKNGHQVLLLLKENRSTRNIPVVIYSTSISDLVRTQLSDAGALNCFIKPWTEPEFRLQVKAFQELTSSFSLNKD